MEFPEAMALLSDWSEDPPAGDLLALIAARLGAWQPRGGRPADVGDLDDLAAFGRATGTARVKVG